MFFMLVKAVLLVIWGPLHQALHIIMNPCYVVCSVYMITCVVHSLGSFQEVNVTLSKCGCATGIKQLALHGSAYSFDPLLPLDIKVKKGCGHEDPFSTENKLCPFFGPCPLFQTSLQFTLNSINDLYSAVCQHHGQHMLTLCIVLNEAL